MEKIKKLTKIINNLVKDNEVLLAHGKIEKYQFNCNKLVGIAIAKKVLLCED